MTRTVTTIAIISLLVMAIGCGPSDRAQGQRLPQRTAYAAPATDSAATGSTDEIDLVEQVSQYRLDYRQSLQLLIEHYTVVGDSKKHAWAAEELRALDRMPQYRYVVDAAVLPANLTASTRIPAADEMYLDAVKTQKQAEPIGILKDQEQMRVAREKYGQLIRQYPNSDKIDDAAYRMAGIYEYFKDYEVALLYYKRAYQWDPDTPYPARFHAAQLLDKKLLRRDEALDLYHEALLREGERYSEWKMYGEKRIKELGSSDDGRL